jgi:long-chain acyl-CoA synthetase
MLQSGRKHTKTRKNMSSKPWLKQYDPGVPATLEYPQVPIFQFLEIIAEKHPHNTCTIFKGNSLNYRQMNTLVNRLAAALVDLGVRKGDRVAVFMPNIPQFVLAYFAILKAGGIVVAINPTYKHGEIAFQLNDSEACLLLGLKDAQPLLETVQMQSSIKQLIFTDIEDAFRLPALADLNSPPSEEKNHRLEPSSPSINLSSLLESYAGTAAPDVGVTSEDAAIFQYSGGTTGTPKAAIGLHRNLVANMLQFRHLMCMLKDGEQTFLNAIPLFHVYGMVIGMGVAVYLGAGMVLIPNPRDLQDILQSIQTYSATVFPGVPNMYHAIGHHPDVISGKYSLQSLKACISGSAPLLRETKEQFERVSGAKLVEGYGLSEAPTATHCNPILGENRTGSIGLPLPDVDAIIINMQDEKTIQPVGEAGELVISSPQLMQGYHKMPEETAQALRDGWLYTGDIATMDKDGYFYLVDRKKDVIKVGGLQVWPREVEEAISSHPSVREVGVAGVPHIQYGETVKAWVVLLEGQEITATEITEWCKERIADFKAPRHVEFIPQLPRTTVGKVLRRELVRQHMEEITAD